MIRTGLNKFFHLTVLLGAFNKRSFIWGIVFIYIKTDSTKNRFFCFITKICLFLIQEDICCSIKYIASLLYKLISIKSIFFNIFSGPSSFSHYVCCSSENFTSLPQTYCTRKRITENDIPDALSPNRRLLLKFPFYFVSH